MKKIFGLKINLAAAAVFFAAAVFSAPSAFAAAAAEPDNIGWITSVKGEAVLRHGWNKTSAKIEEGAEVYLNDSVETKKSASITIQFDDDSLLTVGPQSSITITQWVYDRQTKKNASYFKMAYGSVRGLLSNLFGGGSSLTIETATAVSGVKGSDISVWIEDGETAAAVSEGEGFIRHLDPAFKEEIKLKAGYMARAAKGKAVGRPAKVTEKVKKRISELPAKHRKDFVEKLRKAKELKKKLRDKKHERGEKSKKGGKKNFDEDGRNDEKGHGKNHGKPF